MRFREVDLLFCVYVFVSNENTNFLEKCERVSGREYQKEKIGK